MHQPISRKVELYKPRNGEAGTETCRVVKPSSVKTKEPPSPCGFTYGIAVYGPVCTVVWEGRAGNRSPYPDSLRKAYLQDKPESGPIQAASISSGCALQSRVFP